MAWTENQLFEKQLDRHQGVTKCQVCGAKLDPSMDEETLEDHDRSCEDPFEEDFDYIRDHMEDR